METTDIGNLKIWIIDFYFDGLLVVPEVDSNFIIVNKTPCTLL